VLGHDAPLPPPPGDDGDGVRQRRHAAEQHPPPAGPRRGRRPRPAAPSSIASAPAPRPSAVSVVGLSTNDIFSSDPAPRTLGWAVVCLEAPFFHLRGRYGSEALVFPARYEGLPAPPLCARAPATGFLEVHVLTWSVQLLLVRPSLSPRQQRCHRTWHPAHAAP